MKTLNIFIIGFVAGILTAVFVFVGCYLLYVEPTPPPPPTGLCTLEYRVPATQPREDGGITVEF